MQFQLLTGPAPLFSMPASSSVLSGIAVANAAPVGEYMTSLGCTIFFERSGTAFVCERERTMKKFLLDEKGLELSEYAVAAALVAAACVVAFATLGNVILDRINTLAAQVGP